MSDRATKSDLIDIEVKIHWRTEKAVLVSLDGDKSKAVWLPLSSVEVFQKDVEVAEITLPVWLAEEKRLV